MKVKNYHRSKFSILSNWKEESCHFVGSLQKTVHALHSPLGKLYVHVPHRLPLSSRLASEQALYLGELHMNSTWKGRLCYLLWTRNGATRRLLQGPIVPWLIVLICNIIHRCRYKLTGTKVLTGCPVSLVTLILLDWTAHTVCTWKIKNGFHLINRYSNYISHLTLE